MDLLTICDLGRTIEPCHIRLGRKPSGGIDRLGYPRSVFEPVHARPRNSAINIDVHLGSRRTLDRRFIGIVR